MAFTALGHKHVSKKIAGICAGMERKIKLYVYYLSIS